MNSLGLILGLLASSPAASEDALRSAARVAGATKVGDWVTYRIDGGPGRGAFWRMAAVEEQKGVHGEDLVWLEVELATSPSFAAPMAQFRMLVPHVLNFERQDVQRLLVGFGEAGSEEVGAGALDESLSLRESPTARPPVSVQRDESFGVVQTQTGPVKALRYRLVQAGKILQIYWVSAEVPLLHLAKIEIPGLDQALVVHDFGTDARSRISIPDPARQKIGIENTPVSR